MIKFRIFNKTAGIYHVGFVRELLIDVDKENEHFVLKGYDECQVIEMGTGLKDKNGKDIFVGDIVKVFYSDIKGESHSVIHEVKFIYKELIQLEYANMVEIIGNINENKELLEK